MSVVDSDPYINEYIEWLSSVWFKKYIADAKRCRSILQMTFLIRNQVIRSNRIKQRTADSSSSDTSAEDEEFDTKKFPDGKQLSDEDVSEFLELVGKILRRYFYKLENPYPIMYGTALLTYAAVPHIIVEKWRRLWEGRIR